MCDMCVIWPTRIESMDYLLQEAGCESKLRVAKSCLTTSKQTI